MRPRQEARTATGRDRTQPDITAPDMLKMPKNAATGRRHSAGGILSRRRPVAPPRCRTQKRQEPLWVPAFIPYRRTYLPAMRQYLS